MIKRIIGALAGGGAERASNAVQGIAGIFKENAESKGKRMSDEQVALMEAYAAEMGKVNQHWYDSLVDGFNRLVRPGITVTVFMPFYMLFGDAVNRSIALELFKTGGYWALVATVVAFYFGGRFMEKQKKFSADMAMAMAQIGTILKEQENQIKHPFVNAGFKRLVVTIR